MNVELSEEEIKNTLALLDRLLTREPIQGGEVTAFAILRQKYAVALNPPEPIDPPEA